MALGYLISPTKQIVSENGKPLVGGWVEVFLHTTQTRYITLSDFEGTPNPPKVKFNIKGMTETPVIASDANAYDLYFYDSFGAPFASEENVTISSASAGGSIVEITPTYTGGTKIADYSIDGEGGELRAPSGGGSGEKREGFVNTNGNVTHEISSDDLSQGFCNEDYVICSTEINANPFTAVFLQCTDFWSKNSFSSIDVYAVYEWSGNMEYLVKLFNIDSTALSNNSFKDFSIIGQVSLASNKNVKLRFEWNLNAGASVGDNLLIKCNCFVASTSLSQSLQ